MKRTRKFFTVLLISLSSLLLACVAGAVALYFYLQVNLPDVEVLKDIHLQVPLRVYTADGKLIAQFGAKRRIPVQLNQVPRHMINAVLATEDARFYKHPGVDFIGVARAALAVVVTGRKVQGASTITMQVARNFYLSREKTFSRKIREMLLALKIDKYLDKDKILELYLNKIYFGNRAYGVEAAAEVYYGKTLQQLTLAQMALLAGLPQAPSRNNPLRNPEAAIKRRDHVLDRMLELEFITKAEYQKAIHEPQTASYHSQRVEVSAPYVSEMVREAMVQEFGSGAYERGLSVYTTLRSPLQLAAQESLQQGLLAYDARHGYRRADKNLSSLDPQTWLDELEKEPDIANLTAGAVVAIYPQAIGVLLATGQTITVEWDGLSWARERLQEGYVGAAPESASDIVSEGDVVRVTRTSNGRWRLAEIPEVQGAIVSINPQDGAIFALSGGFDYAVSNFNRVIQAQRQPGSNFKPFIYSAALEKGFTLASIINDAPIVEHNATDDSVWRPMNDNLKFYGPTPLRVGLEQSRNLVSIRLLRAIRVSYAMKYVQRFGFDVNGLPHGLSLALGTASVTPMQLANGYAVFANGGYLVTPYFIRKIVDQHGETLYQADPAMACQACITSDSPPDELLPDRPAPRVITAQNAYLMTQALRGVIQEGTGRAALALGRRDLAGKTGTTNDQVDAWFSGFNSGVVTTVWVGYDNMRSLREYGAEAALPIWVQYMRVALANMPEMTMPEPMDIVRVRIDPRTGLLASPSQRNARFEVFRKSDAPTQYASSVAAGDEGGGANSETAEQLF